jgi:hypothetical protein
MSRRRVTYQEEWCAHFCPQFTLATIYSGSDLAVTEFTAIHWLIANWLGNEVIWTARTIACHVVTEVTFSFQWQTSDRWGAVTDRLMYNDTEIFLFVPPFCWVSSLAHFKRLLSPGRMNNSAHTHTCCLFYRANVHVTFIVVTAYYQC